MPHIHTNKFGLVIGFAMAVFHLIWSLMVLLGIAQGPLDYVFKLHMIENPFVVQAFNLGYAIGLIILTFVIGYIAGVIFAWIWNRFARH